MVAAGLPGGPVEKNHLPMQETVKAIPHTGRSHNWVELSQVHYTMPIVILGHNNSFHAQSLKGGNY